MHSDLETFLERYEKQKKKFEQQLAEGKITQEKYDEWLQRQAGNKEYLHGMADSLTRDLNNRNKIAASMIRGHMREVFVQNANYAEFSIERFVGFNTSFNMYNVWTVDRLIRKKPNLLPKVQVDDRKDHAWNSPKLRNAITQGILKGEGIPKIAKRLEEIFGMNQKASVRNARTATTAAQNGGRLETYYEADEMGIHVKKMWMANVDTRTRHSHRLLDGQVKELHQDFDLQMSNKKIKYPGDPTAPAEEIWNCRCRVVGILRGDDFDASDLSKRYSRIPKSIGYEDWKKMKSAEVEDEEAS